ncbi:DNA/RNA non-specific endonuclease [Streptomyces niveus]|uniref:DNA/RNA non-specific endonuclease n=1 Tax=Streptomyces niveus TaxID=193462 RepID=UPI0033C94CA1
MAEEGPVIGFPSFMPVDSHICALLPLVCGFPDPAQNKDLKDKVIFNRVHIVGDKMSGDRTERNLFTGFQRMNTSGMRRCEIKMERQLAAGNWVQCWKGQLQPYRGHSGQYYHVRPHREWSTVR